LTTWLSLSGENVTACGLKLGVTAPWMCGKMRTNMTFAIAVFRPDTVISLLILINWYV
jgi:hypothetical protein